MGEKIEILLDDFKIPTGQSGNIGALKTGRLAFAEDTSELYIGNNGNNILINGGGGMSDDSLYKQLMIQHTDFLSVDWAFRQTDSLGETGSMIAEIGNISLQILKDMPTLESIFNNSQALNAVLNSDTATAVILNSNVGLNRIMNDTAIISKVVDSPNASKALSNSEQSLKIWLNTFITADYISKSSIALSAMLDSFIAEDILKNSLTAIELIKKNNAFAKYNPSSSGMRNDILNFKGFFVRLVSNENFNGYKSDNGEEISVYAKDTDRTEYFFDTVRGKLEVDWFAFDDEKCGIYYISVV